MKKVETIVDSDGVLLKKCLGLCGQFKPLSEFYHRSDIGSHRLSCKECMRTKSVEYGHKHKKEKAKYNASRYIKNKKSIKEYKRKYFQDNKNLIYAKQKIYCDNNRDKIREYSRKYYQKNKKKIYERKAQKISTNVNFRLAAKLRTRLGEAIKNGQKCGSAVKDLGCSISEFRIYLEAKFYNNPETGEQMSWENYGIRGWHVDHIIPLALFDLADREQFLKACHYTNLQPLWALENLQKSNKVQHEGHSE